MIPAAAHTLPCCLELPPHYEHKAQYALRMLLLPLSLEPTWVARGDLPEGGLYYGTGEAPSNSLALPLEAGTLDYFAGRTRYRPEDAQWHTWDGERWPVLFGQAAPDLIASTFFWLSGWQEITTTARDVHGRFPHAASLQAAWDLTARPPVDAYRARIKAWLVAQGLPVAQRMWKDATWAFCPTHDIDYLRKWRLGTVFRESVEYLLLNYRKEPAGARVRRFGAFLADFATPGDACRRALERMPAETQAYGGTGTYFFKTAAHGPHDVYYRPTGGYLQRQVEQLLTDGFEVGLHPSFHAHTHAGYLRHEHGLLERLAGQPPVSVRQHYLRWDAHLTPRLHVATDFQIDSTLGFAEHEGFRHGTCLPFQLYDADTDAPLDLWEMPLALMESALFNRRGLQGAAARAATQALIDTCQRYGGVLVGLWHNTLWDELDYPGWGQHFLDTLEAARTGQAAILSLHDALRTWHPT